MRTLLRLTLAGLLLTLAMGPALAARLTLVGDVTYRERLLMPAGAVLTVSLVDLAAPSAAIVSARAVTGDRGSVPFRFTLAFEDGLLRAGHTYGVLAEIESADGKYWFRTAQPTPIDPAALGTPLRVITQFQGARPSPTEAFAKLFDLRFEVATLGAVSVVTDRRPSVVVASDMRASGSGGCNNWFAQSDLDGVNLTFSPVAATRMACLTPGLAAQETAFFAALAATRAWSASGDGLDLLDGAGKLLVHLSRQTVN